MGVRRSILGGAAGARTHEAPVEAMGRALDAVSARDARGFFEHCGYRTRPTTMLDALGPVS
jgi:hypothetical protein